MDFEDDFLDAAELRLAGVEDLYLPALQLGVLHVHAHEVSRPEVGLLAAFGAADFQNDVSAVIGIAWAEKAVQTFDDLVDLRFDGGELLSRERLKVLVSAVSQQLFKIGRATSEL